MFRTAGPAPSGGWHPGDVDRAGLESWIGEYVRLWRTPGTDGLAELFTEDATYRPSPWEDPRRGLADIATFWEAERDGPDETFTMTSQVVAVDGEVGVARVEVTYGNGDRWRDIWIARFDGQGRCAEFEEWPIAPRS